MAKYGGNDIDPKTALGTKKQDVYLYDFFTHKPKYIYTTEASRMQKNSKHYDKYANDPKFKKAASNFFAVEAEFPKPDFSRRGPVTHDDQVTSRKFILIQSTEPMEVASQFTCKLNSLVLLINDFKERCKVAHRGK
jgi:hypothetical protein